MIQFCIFSGYEGPLNANQRLILTVFGGCVLRRPTLARMLLSAGRGASARRLNERNRPVARRPRILALTVFGAVSIRVPTMAEEFLDLSEAVRAGELNVEYWHEYAAEIAAWDSGSVSSFTLFGGMDETELPSEADEIEALAVQRHLGTINAESGQILEFGIGQRGAARTAVIQRAVSVG